MYKFVDLHCDTITKALDNNENIFENNLHIDINKLNKFISPTQIFAIWLKKEKQKKAFENTNIAIDFFEKELEKYKKYIKKTVTFDDIMQNNNENKISAILSIEGAESIENNIDNIYLFNARGVQIMTLCWNYENNVGYGAKCHATSGLKPFGRDVIRCMNDINMIVDVSHLNEACFWDTYKISKKPFIATHSNSYSVCENVRNLKDNQLRAIKDVGGIVGINLYPPFLTNDNFADEHNVLEHIEHMIKILGEDKICLGADFDGIDDTLKNMKNVIDYKNLFDKIKKTYGNEILKKICYENFYKFYKKVCLA